MAVRPRSLSVENLESRLNLSSLGGLHVPTISSSTSKAQETALLARYKIISLSDYLKNTSTLSAAKNTNNTSTSTVAAPDTLTATATSTSISLRWADKSNNESGFRIYRSTDGVNFTQINTVGRGKTSYSDTTAAVGTTY